MASQFSILVKKRNLSFESSAEVVEVADKCRRVSLLGVSVKGSGNTNGPLGQAELSSAFDNRTVAHAG